MKNPISIKAENLNSRLSYPITTVIAIIFRSWLAALEITKAIVIHLERKQLLIATEEVSWLGIPMSRWFSVGIYKYKPGYKLHDLL